MDEWIKLKISDIGEVVGGATPLTKNLDNYDGGTIPWITPKDLANHNERYISHGERNITEKGFKSASVKLLPKNSILFSSRAPIGYTAIAENDLTTNQGFKSIIPNNKIDYMFLFYLLKFNSKNIENMGSGTTFKEVSGSVMKNIQIMIPKSKILQLKISKILSDIDEKIELNNKINDNLEQEIALIYQNSLKKFDSRQISLREVVLKANTGADAITKAPIVDYNTGIRCARVGDMSNNRSHLEWGFTNISNLNYNSYKLNKGDILVTRTASIGLNYLIYNDINAVYNNGLIRLKIDDKQIFPLILFREFKTLNFVNYIKKIESETSVRPNMKIDYLLNYKFKILNNNCQNKVYNIIQPLFLEINKNIEKNFKLIELRDVLLPKLMSGEIDVSNIEI